MKRSHLARTMVWIGLFAMMGLFTVPIGLLSGAEAAPKAEPVAVVGADFKVLVGETVTADGRLSYDPEGKKLRFKWELVQVPPGSSARLWKKNSATPSFTADKHGRYIIELRVSNNGIKWSNSALLTVATDYPQNALVPVNTRLVKSPTTTNPLSKYNIQVGENYYTAPPYKAGTETSTPTGFQVLVLERDTLLPATQFTYHQSFSGTSRGYLDMISFLKTLTDKGLLVIISPFDNTLLYIFINQAVELAAIIQNLGGTENFLWTITAPQDIYSLIGIPGIGAGNGIEMCGWDHYASATTASIQGIFTKDKYSNFQFIYPNFTTFETKSWANSAGDFSGSVRLGSKEAIYGGKLPSGQGAFQVVTFRRDNADWSSEPPESSVWYTNVPGFESMSVKSMVAQLKGLTAGNPNGFGFPAPDSYMVIIQSIGVPFGRSSLYDQQSIMDLEKLINNLGGSEYAFHAIFENPGTPPSPNKYSLLGIAKNDLSVTLPTMPTLGPTESVEASTLKLQDGNWTVLSGSDGNVRGVINKNKQGMYVPFLASEGVAGADLSLPLILFQNPTPWITGPAGEDPTPYLAAYAWISTFITGAPPQNLNGTCSTPGAVAIKGGTCGDLRTYYPTIDNLWNEVGNMLYSTGAMDNQVNMFCQSATGMGSDFNCDQYQWMKDQLYREVQKVEVAKELFQDDIGSFFKALATYQSLSLSEFYANAYNTLGIDPQSPNPTQSILNVVQSVFTRASLMGVATGRPAVAVIGGIASAAVAVASHFIPDSNANPVAGVISTTIKDLWQDLTTNFLTEDFVARKSYELVVSDWGKLQAAENLWNQWNTDTTEEALASMIVGFEAYLYKVLIPLAYQVEKLPGTQCSTLTDFETCSKSWNTGNECEYYGHHAGVPLPNYVALASQAWDPLQARQANDLYWVYKGNHTTGNFSYIPKTTLENIFAPFDYYDLTKLGVSPVDFFTRWPFTYSDCPLYEDWCYTCGHLW